MRRSSRASVLVIMALMVAVVLGGGLATPGCGGQASAKELEVTYYYLPG